MISNRTLIQTDTQGGGTSEVLEVRPSSSKPDRGIARMKYQGVNQRDEAVLSFIINHLLKRRQS